MCKEFKDKYISLMAENLTLLRTSINLTQEDLAEIIGLSRYTLISIESGQRKMTWNTFLSLLLVFQKNEKSYKLMKTLEIYNDELNKYLAVDNKQQKRL